MHKLNRINILLNCVYFILITNKNMQRSTSLNMIAPMEKSSDSKKHRPKPLDILMSILVRFVFIFQSCFVLYFLWGKTKFVLLLLIGILVIIADTVFVIIKRNGKEHLW
jgi:hypothetical protein